MKKHLTFMIFGAVAFILLSLTQGQAAEQEDYSARTSPGAFNPAISLILSGTYANLSQDPAAYRITGFMRPVDNTGRSTTDIGPGTAGFSLNETELGVYGNIDQLFYGGLNLAILQDNTISVEEAFFQITTLPYGLTLKGGRFFSGVGYLNEQHAHTWDFVDNPLAYQAFLGTQMGEDGVQLKWIAPAELLIELGGEAGRGLQFPGTSNSQDSPGAYSGFLHIGGELGEENSWRVGFSNLQTSPQNRYFSESDLAGASHLNSFSGDSRLYIADLVWKWAPNGDAVYTSFKLQGEYMKRDEKGIVMYDTSTARSPDLYSSAQSGYYIQAVYKFLKLYRIGFRNDSLNGGTVSYGTTNNSNIQRYAYNPSRNTVMLDISPSEFSRFRIQYSVDNSRQGAQDNQIFFQYQMSIGAHGAHKF